MGKAIWHRGCLLLGEYRHRPHGPHSWLLSIPLISRRFRSLGMERAHSLDSRLVVPMRTLMAFRSFSESPCCIRWYLPRIPAHFVRGGRLRGDDVGHGKVPAGLVRLSILCEAHVQINFLVGWTKGILSWCLPNPTACLCPSGIEDQLSSGRPSRYLKDLVPMIFCCPKWLCWRTGHSGIVYMGLVGARDLGGLVSWEEVPFPKRSQGWLPPRRTMRRMMMILLLKPGR